MRPPSEIAAELELYARAVASAGDKAAAMHLEAVAEMLRHLPVTHRSGKLDKMVSAERMRHSEAAGDSRDALVVAANAAGYTLRSLGEAIGKSHAHLSRARRGIDSIATATAARVEALTGFRASKRNWPKLKV